MTRILDISGGLGGGNLEYQTEITSSLTLSTQKGLNKVYPVNSSSAVVITVPAGYVENDVINFQRQGNGTVEFVADSGVRIRGVRDIENRYFINDTRGIVSLLCEGSDVFSVIGNLKRGYTGAVTTSNYSLLNEGATNQDVTVTGTGFSANMLVTVSANATLNSFTFVTPTELTLNLDAVGVENDTVTVTYDNGDVFVDTDAITIAPPALDVANLFAYYKFNGNANDERGNHNATLTGGSYVSGLIGQAVNIPLSGVGDNVTIPYDTAFNFGTNAFSIHGMMTLDSLNAVNWVLMKRDAGGAQGQYLVLLESGELGFFVYDTDNSNRIGKSTTASGISTSTRFHFVLTYDGGATSSSLNIYINGALETVSTTDDGTFVQMRDFTNPVKIGAAFSSSVDANNELDGDIDVLGFWNEEISAAKALEIYNTEIAGTALL